MSEQDRPKLEEDVKIARILGLVLMVVIPTFSFYTGTIFGKEWKFDYQLKDLGPGLLGFAIGLTIAVIINGYIWLKYTKTVSNDLEGEWYGPQAGHHDHH
ncbi:MAG TPA: hypothetical protein VK171_03670 [Fimbriimonas sp.]|nr:hypothetical protein [Fimbriimonas sp.]